MQVKKVRIKPSVHLTRSLHNLDLVECGKAVILLGAAIHKIPRLNLERVITPACPQFFSPILYYFIIVLCTQN